MGEEDSEEKVGPLYSADFFFFFFKQSLETQKLQSEFSKMKCWVAFVSFAVIFLCMDKLPCAVHVYAPWPCPGCKFSANFPDGPFICFIYSRVTVNWE